MGVLKKDKEYVGQKKRTRFSKSWLPSITITAPITHGGSSHPLFPEEIMFSAGIDGIT
jgi:hypothetical protein